MISLLAVISVLRYLKDFHYKHYQHWHQGTLYSISLGIGILPSVLTFSATLIRCNGVCHFHKKVIKSLFNNTHFVNADPCRSIPNRYAISVVFAMIFICNFFPICYISVRTSTFLTTTSKLFLLQYSSSRIKLNRRKVPLYQIPHRIRTPHL